MLGKIDMPQNNNEVAEKEFDETMSDILHYYTDIKQLNDGRTIGTMKLMFHWAIHIGIDLIGYSDRYCFTTYEIAKKAFDEWNGEGEPNYWHRHPTTGRRREPSTGKEWIDF